MTHHTPPTNQQLDTDREMEIRTLDLAPLMSDRSAAVISGHLAALLAELDRLRTELAAEQSQHEYTLRQRNNRSHRLLHLRDLADTGEVEALSAAARDVLAASVNDHATDEQRAAAVPAFEAGE